MSFMNSITMHLDTYMNIAKGIYDIPVLQRFKVYFNKLFI